MHSMKRPPKRPPKPALVAVNYRVRPETRERIRALSDLTGIRMERLVDQLLGAALDLREAMEQKGAA